MGWGGDKGGKGGKEKGGKGAKPSYHEPTVMEASGGNDDEELIWAAVYEAVKPILRFERELDENKLQKRIRDCFRKGAKGLSYHGKAWYDLINEYADIAFSGIFSSLGEKEWLAQCDFLLCLDAGVKDNFPKNVLSRVPQKEFEQVVLAAHDRAHEEQRVLPILWEVIHSSIDGPKGKKKVYNAAEEAWKEAFAASGQTMDAQGFVGALIDGTVARISAVSQGEPGWVMEPQLGMTVFDELLQAGAMPYALVEAHGAPPAGWPFIGYCVEQAYGMHTVVESEAPRGKGKMGKGGKGDYGKGKGKGKTKRPNPLLADMNSGLCRDFLLDRCARGEECKFPHDEGAKQEVDLKRALAEADDEEAEAKRSRLE